MASEQEVYVGKEGAQELYRRLKGKVDDLATEVSAEIDDLDGRSTALEGRADALESRATVLEGDVATLDNRADALEDRTTTLEGDVATLDNRADALEDRATALEGRATELEERATELETDVGELRSDLTDLTEHVNTELAKKEDVANKVADWSAEPSDTQYPTEKLVKDTIDEVVSDLSEDISDLREEMDGKLATKEDVANKVSSWQNEPDDDHYPTEKLVKDTIEAIGKPLVWIGPAPVSYLNAPDQISGLKPGWTYTVTDRGTLDDGYDGPLKVSPGDEVAWTSNDKWFKVGTDGVVVFNAMYTNGEWTWPDAEAVVSALASSECVIIRTTGDGIVRYYTFSEQDTENGTWTFASGDDSIIVVEFDGTDYTWNDPDYAIVAGTGISVEKVGSQVKVNNTNHLAYYEVPSSEITVETIEDEETGEVKEVRMTVPIENNRYSHFTVGNTITRLVIRVGDNTDLSTVSRMWFEFTLPDDTVLEDVRVLDVNDDDCLVMGPMKWPGSVTYQGRVLNHIVNIVGYSEAYYNGPWISTDKGKVLVASYTDEETGETVVKKIKFAPAANVEG